MSPPTPATTPAAAPAAAPTPTVGDNSGQSGQGAQGRGNSGGQGRQGGRGGRPLILRLLGEPYPFTNNVVDITRRSTLRYIRIGLFLSLARLSVCSRRSFNFVTFLISNSFSLQ